MSRLAVDIGGTFTDAIFLDDQTGLARFYKAPSTPDDYARGLMDSIEPFKSALGDLELFVHGTTVCINAIIQGKLSLTGFITTAGFRDVLEIQRSNRPAIYDAMYRKPRPLVPRHLRFEVPERTLYNGEIVESLNEDAVMAVLNKLAQAGVEAIGVCLLNSFANETNEARIVDLIRRRLPSVCVTKSTDLTREYREYERSCTAVFNAGLMPVMRTYLQSLKTGICDLGFVGDVHIMQSNGGMMTSGTACDRPVQTINSGLVGGVVATHILSKLLDEPNAIGTDMGGTSFDVAIIADGRYNTLPQMKIATPESGGDSYPIQIPTLDTHAIGAGGGSIAWVDEGDLLHVGPQSSGADPGPACYGRGGIEPTVTDANLLLGRLDTEFFLGGRMSIYPVPAREAVERIATRFDQTAEETAEGIVTIAVNNMANAIGTMTISRGIDPREFVMVSAGGAGPLHASLIARELMIPKVIVPPIAGNFAAWGM